MCTVVVNDIVTPDEDLCVIDGPVSLDKSKNFTKVMMNIADADYEQVLWDQFNNDWKIFQVRVYEWIH